ncbi:MAG: acyl-CoA thioesterase [bacterium]
MHIFKTNIKLYQTDAAGILFFSRLFEVVHDAYQDFLDKAQFGISEILKNRDFLTPVIHAEADYKMPLEAGDAIEVRINIGEIGRSSYTLLYDILKNNQIAGQVKIIHVSVDRRSGKKIGIPERLKDILLQYLND